MDEARATTVTADRFGWVAAMAFVRTERDLLRICLQAMRAVARTAKERAKRLTITELFALSIDRYSLSTYWDAWARAVAQTKRAASYNTKVQQSKRYLVALAETLETTLVTHFFMYEHVWQDLS